MTDISQLWLNYKTYSRAADQMFVELRELIEEKYKPFTCFFDETGYLELIFEEHKPMTWRTLCDYKVVTGANSVKISVIKNDMFVPIGWINENGTWGIEEKYDYDKLSEPTSEAR